MYLIFALLTYFSASRALKQPCTFSTCVPMGLDSPFFPGKGAYYVPTQKKSPFCGKIGQKTEMKVDEFLPAVIR